MFSAAVRVATRAAAIQLEEIAAKSGHHLVEQNVRIPRRQTRLGRSGTVGRVKEENSVNGQALAAKHAWTEGLEENFEVLLDEPIPMASSDGRTLTIEESKKSSTKRSKSFEAPETSFQRGKDGFSINFNQLIEGESPAESSRQAQERAAAPSVPQPASGPVQSVTSDTVDIHNRNAYTEVTPPDLLDDVEKYPPPPIKPEETTMIQPETTVAPTELNNGGDEPMISDNELEGRPFGKGTDGALESLEEAEVPVVMRASKVPSSRLGRLVHYGSLAASLGWGAAAESIRRSTGGTSSGSVFMSDANVRRLVASLSRMRGAALKLGQFMSIQDNHMLPPEIERVLQQVQAHANYMPDWQMERVMSQELGSNWSSLFSTFDRTPIASASIGQVHRATLASTGQAVAVKVQFPGMAQSIKSDLSYLTPLLASSAVLPRGMYLQNTIAVMKRELEDECDYIREAESGRRFRKLLEGDEYLDVPMVIDEASTAKVLTTEWMEGKPLSKMKGMNQETRNKIGTNILRLCLQELFHFKFMQTDPNWANFLYNQQADRIGLIDFGASREYSTEFMDGWYALLTSTLKGDKDVMRIESENIGYLTGEEDQLMVDAHLTSMSLLSAPFGQRGPYDFASQQVTQEVRKLIPVMLKHRLTPPPPETYSLNRKLSGAFLMCARLGAKVNCAELWEQWAGDYETRREGSLTTINR